MITTINFISNSIFELENRISSDLNLTKKHKDNLNILVQIFISKVDKNLILEIQKLFKFYLPKAKLIGTTTDGEFINGKITNNTISCSISIFEKTQIESFIIDNNTNSLNSFDVGTKMGLNLKNKKIELSVSLKTIITFTDGLFSNGENYLKGLNLVKQDTIIAGGMAGDNGEFKETFVFNDEKILSNGAVAVGLFGDDLIVNNNYHFGWVPIGEKFKITEVKENRVYKIDDVTPLEIYKKYLGEEFAKELPSVGVEFPLILEKPSMNEHNLVSHVGRAVLNRHDDGSLSYAGNLHVGDEVRFGIGNYDSILSISQENFSKYKKLPIETIFVYSCMARRRFLQNDIIVEMSPFKQLAPTSGFFTYGEFFSNKQASESYKSELLNQTMTVLILSESETIRSFDESNNNIFEKVNPKQKSKTIEALSHIIDTTSKIQKKRSDELEFLNSSLEAKIYQAVEENRKKDQMILRHSKLAQMGELISMIAHQWRQPLGSISSTILGVQTKLQLGRFDLSDPKEAEQCEFFVDESLSRMTEYVKFLSDTIDEFRSFFKPNRTPEKLTIDLVVKKSVYIIEKSLTAKNISFQKECNSHREFLGYKNEIIQVILNIIKNAEDILLEKKVKNPEIRIQCYVSGKYDILEISDNAGGIPAELLDRIFEPYFSTKNEKNGTGLGLYMSKTIIEDHCKGILNVSNNDQGAVFKIGFNVENTIL
jgi:nitrogen-specific signal transduction histidine kinase